VITLQPGYLIPLQPNTAEATRQLVCRFSSALLAQFVVERNSNSPSRKRFTPLRPEFAGGFIPTPQVLECVRSAPQLSPNYLRTTNRHRYQVVRHRVLNALQNGRFGAQQSSDIPSAEIEWGTKASAADICDGARRASFNLNAYIGTLAPFRNVVCWNISYSNNVNGCNQPDGNGLIMDRFDIGGTTYPFRSLVAFNIVHNNGGSGLDVWWQRFRRFMSDHVTAAKQATTIRC
jgi:hypothetical protein